MNSIVEFTDKHLPKAYAPSKPILLLKILSCLRVLFFSRAYPIALPPETPILLALMSNYSIVVLISSNYAITFAPSFINSFLDRLSTFKYPCLLFLVGSREKYNSSASLFFSALPLIYKLTRF